MKIYVEILSKLFLQSHFLDIINEGTVFTKETVEYVE